MISQDIKAYLSTRSTGKKKIGTRARKETKEMLHISDR